MVIGGSSEAGVGKLVEHVWPVVIIEHEEKDIMSETLLIRSFMRTRKYLRHEEVFLPLSKERKYIGIKEPEPTPYSLEP